MAGRGSRFSKAGYTFPKPLIEVKNKPMIQVVTENLDIKGRYIYLVLDEHYDKYALKYLLPLIAKPNDCEIVRVDRITEGAACTVLLAEELINNDEELILANSDQWVNWDSGAFLDYMRGKDADGGIVSFKACFGYNTLIDTKEFGKIPLGKIVTQKLDCSVLGFNKETKKFEYTKVKDFIRLDGESKKWKKITSKWGGVTYATEDHEFLTNNGWQSIGNISDNIITSFSCMSSVQKEVFNGTMLGDGSISSSHRSYVNSGLKFAHSMKQKDWALFKLSVFDNLSSDYYEDLGDQYESIFCRVKISEEFKDEKERWYPDGKKIVPPDLKLTPITIAVWYMDDGGLTTNKTPTARFATNCFDFESISILRSKFSEIGIKTYLVKEGQKEFFKTGKPIQYRIVVSTESSDDFFNLISGYVVPSMQYKLPAKYRKRHFHDGKFRAQFVGQDNLYYYKPKVEDFNEIQSYNKYAFCLETELGNFIVDNMVAHNCHPKWSFAKVQEITNLVTEVAEKKPISNCATAGIYYFKKGKYFVEGARKMIEKNIRTNNEFYVCPVFNELIEDEKRVYTYHIDEMLGLGTPEDLEHYLKVKK